MKECREIREMLSELLDGELAGDKKTLVEQHLALCPRCSAASSDLKRTLALLKGLEPVEPPPWLESKIMARIAEEVAPKQSLWHRLVGSMSFRVPLQAAALIAVCVTGYYLARTTAPQLDLNVPAERAPLAPKREETVAQPAPAAGTAAGTSPTNRGKTGPGTAAPTPQAAPHQEDTIVPLRLEEKSATTKQAPAAPAKSESMEPPVREPERKAIGYPGDKEERARMAESPAPPAAAPAAREAAPMAAPLRFAGPYGDGAGEAPPHAAKKAKAFSPAPVTAPLVITITATNDALVARGVAAAVRDMGGAVTRSDEVLRTLEARIDASRLSDFLKKIENLGKVRKFDAPPSEQAGRVAIVVRW